MSARFTLTRFMARVITAKGSLYHEFRTLSQAQDWASGRVRDDNKADVSEEYMNEAGGWDTARVYSLIAGKWQIVADRFADGLPPQAVGKADF